jgi:hypothetical protein
LTNGLAFVTLLLYTLSLPALPREGGGDGSALFIGVSEKWKSGLRVDLDEDSLEDFDAGVGLDISTSGSRVGRFASRGESGDGEFLSGEEERGEET